MLSNRKVLEKDYESKLSAMTGFLEICEINHDSVLSLLNYLQDLHEIGNELVKETGESDINEKLIKRINKFNSQCVMKINNLINYNNYELQYIEPSKNRVEIEKNEQEVLKSLQKIGLTLLEENYSLQLSGLLSFLQKSTISKDSLKELMTHIYQLRGIAGHILMCKKINKSKDFSEIGFSFGVDDYLDVLDKGIGSLKESGDINIKICAKKFNELLELAYIIAEREDEAERVVNINSSQEGGVIMELATALTVNVSEPELNETRTSVDRKNKILNEYLTPDISSKLISPLSKSYMDEYKKRNSIEIKNPKQDITINQKNKISNIQQNVNPKISSSSMFQPSNKQNISLPGYEEIPSSVATSILMLYPNDYKDCADLYIAISYQMAKEKRVGKYDEKTKKWNHPEKGEMCKRKYNVLWAVLGYIFNQVNLETLNKVILDNPGYNKKRNIIGSSDTERLLNGALKFKGESLELKIPSLSPKKGPKGSG